MTTGHYPRRPAPLRSTGANRTHREENFFLAVIGFSLILHLIVGAIFSYSPTATTPRRPPTLYVNLVIAPVANPQRGSSSVAKTVEIKPIAPVVAPPPTAVPTKVPKEPVVVKSKETKKTAKVKDDDIAKDIAAAMAKMKQSKAAQDEREDVEKSVAAMRKKATSTPPATAAVGSASGTGDEAGSAIGDWLQSAVKEKWTWTDRKRKDLSAEIEVNFDASGKLTGYRFLRTSGDARFDKSLTDALIKLEALPQPLRNPFKGTILFNLDDLQGQ